jgi:hypothetical protein
LKLEIENGKLKIGKIGVPWVPARLGWIANLKIFQFLIFNFQFLIPTTPSPRHLLTHSLIALTPSCGLGNLPKDEGWSFAPVLRARGVLSWAS